MLLLLVVLLVVRLDLDVVRVVHGDVAAAIHGVVDEVLVVFRVRGHVSCRGRVHLAYAPVEQPTRSALLGQPGSEGKDRSRTHRGEDQSSFGLHLVAKVKGAGKM